MTFKRSRIVAALAGLCNIKLDTATPEQKAQLAALDEATDAELLALAPPAIDPNAPKAITQDQLDAAVATAVEATRTSERARTTALDQAITDVEPLVGTVSGMDSAEAVYRFALDKAQVPDSATLPAAALPSLVALAIKAKAPAAAPLANDEAPATLAGCFPSVGAIRRLG